MIRAALRETKCIMVQAFAWRTVDPVTEQACQGLGCPAFGIIECVKEGEEPLQPDDKQNIGCGNQGSNNIGSWNSEGGNWGSCNSGEEQPAAASSQQPAASHLRCLSLKRLGPPPRQG